MAKRPALAKLAEAEGILPSYVDNRRVTQLTKDETSVALLAAMGIDASDEATARRSISERQARTEGCLIDPVMVRRVNSAECRRIAISIPATLANRALEYIVELQLESGATLRNEGRIRARPDRNTVTLPIPETPNVGYHRLQIGLSSDAVEVKGSSSFIVSPDACLRFEDLCRERKFGIWTHLYTVRGRKDWGVGDLSDLEELVLWAEECGAAFVGINPLHSLNNSDGDISPYSPVSRLFHNPLYIDVSAIPDLEDDPKARALIQSRGFKDSLLRLQERTHVDYAGVMELKNRVFESLHRTFVRNHGAGGTRRGLDYANYLEGKGDALNDFATFVVLARHLREEGHFNPQSWPLPYREARSDEVDAFRNKWWEEIDRERYLQFEFDRQLRKAAQSASHLPIGLYGDLAIGTAGTGADPWAFPGLFLDGVTLGSPPDAYSTEGQDWGFPPMDPRMLWDSAYRYWILLLRNALEHAGALRIDHVMGLFRQYWVPRGRPATDGAYVRFPANDLLGILALESHRNSAMIVGEDLGTVPRGLPSRLARWGILSSSVLYFQRDRRGGFKPSRDYSRRALVTANTHDHPPLAGYWIERDLELRRQAGELARPAELDAARLDREVERRALIRRLRAERCLPAENHSVTPDRLCAAVYRFLSRTPAPLVGVWLDDLAGETEPLNLPGIGLDRYGSWSRRAGTKLERLRDDPTPAKTLASLADRSRR
ncbi:MAG: 4-alpha-glucanotransferase [Gemmatimonadota bacterium]|nr:MAG: 4-alpha-glucanotransferase [Gemmatimonadota bacterium]